MSETLQVGCAWRVSAATPATCGEAIDVPEMTAAWLPVPLPVEMMLTPGAVMSGFRKLSSERGPPELNEANAVNCEFTICVGVTLAVWPVANFGPSVFVTPRNGMVTVKGTPVSGFDVIVPSKGGSPAALLTISTAAAPACWPKSAFATRAQVPRLTTASVLGGSGPPKA